MTRSRGMPDQVHGAGLNHSLEKYSADRLGKALQALDEGHQDTCDAAVFELVHNPQSRSPGQARGLKTWHPRSARSRGRESAIGQNAERDVVYLVANEALVTDFDPDGIEEDQEIGSVERPVPSFGDVLQNRIGDGGDQLGRHLDAVNLLHMRTDLAGRKAPRIHRDNFVVKAGETPPVFGDELGIEVLRSVARHRECHL